MFNALHMPTQPESIVDKRSDSWIDIFILGKQEKRSTLYFYSHLFINAQRA